MSEKSINDTLKEFNEIMKKLGLEKESLSQKAYDNPNQFLIDIGVNVAEVDKTELFSLLKSLTDINKLKVFSENSNYKNANNLTNSIINKTTFTQADVDHQKTLAARALDKDLKSKVRFCFVESLECDEVIDSHSIQENRELSAIAKQGNVLQFVRKGGERKEIKPIHVNTASTFPGFCYKHDQIFNPIDNNRKIDQQQKLFLYSLRSFAFSYYNITSTQNYNLSTINTVSEGILSIVDSLEKVLTLIGHPIPKEFNEMKNNVLTDEQSNVLKAQRFETYRIELLQALNDKNWSELDYFTYETDHLSPIVCSSWMIMHLNIGGAYSIIYDEKHPEKIYNGMPIIISVLPDGNKTKVILARFRSDIQSEFIFRQIKDKILDKQQLEIEISKLIIENVSNFFLSPIFWDKLNESERAIINDAVTLAKNEFPEKRIEFEMINFFDEKYKLNEY